MKVLNYSKWGNFIKVIDKAKETCKNSKNNILEHFADVGKTIKRIGGTMPEDLPTPSKSAKEIENLKIKKLKQ